MRDCYTGCRTRMPSGPPDASRTGSTTSRGAQRRSPGAQSSPLSVPPQQDRPPPCARYAATHAESKVPQQHQENATTAPPQPPAAARVRPRRAPEQSAAPEPHLTAALADDVRVQESRAAARSARQYAAAPYTSRRTPRPPRSQKAPGRSQGLPSGRGATGRRLRLQTPGHPAVSCRPQTTCTRPLCPRSPADAV